MLSRTASLRSPVAAYAVAVLLIAASYVPYAVRFSPAGRWQAGNYDPADYRYVAEFFWGVPIVPETYDGIWQGPWGHYLQTVPFRTIGLGTLYLVSGWLRLGHAPQTVAEVDAAGTTLAYGEKALLAIALVTLFAAVRRSWGTGLAFLALILTIVPPLHWRISDDFITESAHRVVFIFAMAAAIAMRGRRTASAAFVLMALLFVATQIKVQWYVGAVMLLPALLLQFWRERLSVAASVALCVATLLVPAGVLLVNWAGWNTPSMNPGIGLHVNLRYDGAVLREYSESVAADPGKPLFADLQRPQLRWWNIHVDPGASREQYQAFDRFSQAFLRRHLGTAIGHFWDGIVRASTFPGIERMSQNRLRIEPLDQPWRLLTRLADIAVWALLVVGLLFDETRVPCALALVLWIIPAIGNIVSNYEIRYHLPMAGLGAIAASLVATRIVRGVRL
jgi:hypothetical protein